MYRPTSFSQLPEVVKNLLIINGLCFLAKITLENKGIDLIKLIKDISYYKHVKENVNSRGSLEFDKKK